jgi:hypothetical protein
MVNATSNTRAVDSVIRDEYLRKELWRDNITKPTHEISHIRRTQVGRASVISRR